MTEAASGYCGHCFCIGCFGCSLSSSFRCPTCREPVVDLVRQFTVEQIAAHIPLLKDVALQVGVTLAQKELELDSSRRGLSELEMYKAKAQRLEAELQAASLRFANLREQCEAVAALQKQTEEDVEELQKQNLQLHEELRLLRQEARESEEALQRAKLLENAVVNMMEDSHSMLNVVIGTGWQELCEPMSENQVWQKLGLHAAQHSTCSIAEFGVVREYLQDLGQECMGNMSLGISQDMRFKLEYYGSNQHVFNEIEIEGCVQVEGRQLTFLGVRSASSRRYDGEGPEVPSDEHLALPPLKGLLCSRGDSTWIVLFEFSACAQISIFNAADIILLKDPVKHFTGYQRLAW
ncbi:Pdi [Symbiodinium pilosum]|uniref:Pdi protein n=1 Tax=Symbiodinium pilosum TaxID=2952 RepID=A0A812JW59_SYMPI|nr:Pdi [Symbiodinium pilosum]